MDKTIPFFARREPHVGEVRVIVKVTSFADPTRQIGKLRNS